MRPVRQALRGEALDAALLEELWRFITSYVTRARGTFEQALQSYEFVTIWRRDGAITGFAANKLWTTSCAGRRVQVIYTGWTILSPAMRGKNFLQAEGLRCWLVAKRRRPLTPVYWVFGASTFKSYLLLPRNLNKYFPRRGVAWAPFELALRDQVMAGQHDPNWDPAAGVVHRNGASRYLEGVVQDLAAAPDDPDIAFYAAQNPRQHEGDTVLVVVPLSPENWWSMAMKQAARTRRRKG